MQPGSHHTSQYPGYTPVPAYEAAREGLAGRHLILDVTSFLLAAHFEFLAAIESAFRPIGVSAALISSLQLMREQLSAVTPRPTEPPGRILRLVAGGFIRSVSGDLPFPPPARAPYFRAGCTAASSGGRVISLHHLIRSVVEPFANSGRFPQSGDVIVCPAAVLVDLARRDLLEFAASRFSLVIQESELNGIRAELQSNADLHQLLTWFDDQIDHIRCGLVSGAYALQPLTVPLDQPPSQAAFLRSVVEPSHNKMALIWVDCRSSTPHYGSAHTPTVDVVQALTELREAGYITEFQVHSTMFRMREANIVCLPLTPDELLSYLRSAAPRVTGAVENDRLAALRRNLSLSLECGGSLLHEETVREYATSLLSVAEEAIVRCWIATSTADHRTAGIRADWLFDNIYWDALAALPPGQRAPRLAAGFAGMIARAYRYWPGRGRAGAPRQSCLAWLGSRLEALPSSAGFRHLLHSHIIGLPPTTRDQILFDPLLRGCLGLRAETLHHVLDPAH